MKVQNFNFNLKSTRDPESEQLLYVITIFKKERVKVSIGKKVLVKGQGKYWKESLGKMLECEGTEMYHFNRILRTD